MLRTAHAHLGRRWDSALVIAPEPAPQSWPVTDWIVGAHPVPDARSEAAGRAALTLAATLGSDDLLLLLLSGGASSLMAAPVEGVDLSDKRAAQATLLREGADIGELNAVRKHLSGIKGGQLAMATKARVLTLAMSDVVGDDPSTIGSGPTVADPTTFADAWAVLERRGGAGRYPASVVAHLRSGVHGERVETPKVIDEPRTQFHIVASLDDALGAAEVAAAELGYRVIRIGQPIVGEARVAGAELLRHAISAAEGGPCCVIAGGETTVRVVGTGRGGRNQELALAMVGALADTATVVAASVGTDGVDGPTDAAGAIVDSTTAVRAREHGLDPAAHLDDNNSYRFFDALGDLVRTGPTGTNVGDIQIVMMSKESVVRR